MSSEPAPLYTTTIFNQSNFNTSTSGSSSIGLDYLDANYTKFPTAQTGATQTIFDLAITQPNIKVNNITIGKGVNNISTNTAFGYNSLITATGANNTAFGSSVLDALTSGTRNTGIGSGALSTVITGSNNVGIGYNSLALATGNNNTAIGSSSGSTITTGTTNTIIGYNSGSGLTTGSNNTLIGNDITISSNISNSTGIGNNLNITASNTVVLGSSAYTSMYCSNLFPLYTTPPTTADGIGYKIQSITVSSTAVSSGVITSIVDIDLTLGIYYMICNIEITVVSNTLITVGINNQSDLSTTPNKRSSVFLALSGAGYVSVCAVNGTTNPVNYKALVLTGSNSTVAAGASIVAVRVG